MTNSIVRLPNGNGKGYAILQEGGNPVYFPENMIDFCDDWLGGIHKVTNVLNAHEDLVKALFDLRHAFYVEGNTKALKAAFEKTHNLAKQLKEGN